MRCCWLALLIAVGSICSAQPVTPVIVAHRGSSADRPENTLAAYSRAIESGADAIEVDLRLTRDGELVSIHNPDLDATNGGSGPVADHTLAEIQALDAGSWFSPEYADERVPTFIEILGLARGRVDVFVDLKEASQEYHDRILEVIGRFADPRSIILGIRSVEQARYFRTHLPRARQVGLIPEPGDTEAFAGAGIRVIRLWPEWLAEDPALAGRVRAAGAELLLSAGAGSPEEIEALAPYHPEWLFADDPARVREAFTETAPADQPEK